MVVDISVVVTVVISSPLACHCSPCSPFFLLNDLMASPMGGLHLSRLGCTADLPG